MYLIISHLILSYPSGVAISQFPGYELRVITMDTTPTTNDFGSPNVGSVAANLVAEGMYTFYLDPSISARHVAVALIKTDPSIEIGLGLCEVQIFFGKECRMTHYCEVIMSAMASQIVSLTIVYSTVYSGDQTKYQSSASLAFVRGIHRWPVNSPHKGPVTWKMFPFDDVIMWNGNVINLEKTPFTGCHF